VVLQRRHCNGADRVAQPPQQWEECDEALLRSMLGAYDQKWGSSARLLEVYDRIVAEAA
jgi:hypothetical protein